MTVKIITDTSSDFSIEQAKEYGVELLSIYISDGEKEYKDLIDINSQDIFKGQEKNIKFTTSQIPVFEYYTNFKKVLDEGNDFIYISLSSGMSGSYNNSLLAIEELKKEYKQSFIALDSKAASVGLGLIVRYLAEAAKKGLNYNDLIEFAEFLIENVVHLFTVFNLDELYRGGRLRKSTANIGNLLSIRPIIHVVDGELKLREISKGNKMVYKKISNEIIKTMKSYGEDELIYLVYGKERNYIDPLFEKYKKESNLKRIDTNPVGCTISIHTGSEFFGNAFLKKEIPEKFKKYSWQD